MPGAKINSLELCIRIPGRAWNLNDAFRTHWTDNSTKTAEYRAVSFILWKNAIRNWCHEQGVSEKLRLPPGLKVVAQPFYKSAKSLPDTGACAPVVKAAVDGLIDAGAIPDDGYHWIYEITYRAPIVKGSEDYLLICVLWDAE